MRILLLGATGFLGRHICAHLLDRGHQVVAGVRDLKSATRRFPGIETIHVDMNRMVEADSWLSHVRGVDAVVNCAGILQSGYGQFASAIHTNAPIAMFDACCVANVRRVIQVSAVSADAAVGTEYALTKKAADDYLRTLDLDWIVLRPSLVYAQGSFGGTSALRGLAGLPFITPLVGDGDQKFQPIHADDLAETVSRCLENPKLVRQTLDPVGPEITSLRDILVKLRAWLDLPASHIVKVPLAIVHLAAHTGDLFGRGPLRSTAITQLLYGNISDSKAFQTAIGFRPRSLGQALRSSPSHVQDRWHARLYWLFPFLTCALALMWMGSGMASVLDFNAAKLLAQKLGVPDTYAVIITLFFAALDFAIGVGIILNRPRWLGGLQFGLVAGYTLVFTAMQTGLWLNPLGPLLKNLPILAAIGVWIALRDDK